MTLFKYLIKLSSLVEPSQFPYNFPSLCLCSLQCTRVESYLPIGDAYMALIREHNLCHITFAKYSRAPSSFGDLLHHCWKMREVMYPWAGKGTCWRTLTQAKHSVFSQNYLLELSAEHHRLKGSKQLHGCHLIAGWAFTHMQLTWLSAFLQNQLHLDPKAA